MGPFNTINLLDVDAKLSFFVASMFLELPWINSLMSITSKRPVLLFAMWTDIPEYLIHVLFVNEKYVTINGV